MNGKALLVKSITVREQDTYSNYVSIPPMSLVEAAARLEKDPGG